MTTTSLATKRAPAAPAAPPPYQASALACHVTAHPCAIDSYSGPMHKVGPAPSSRHLEARINALLPQLVAATNATLQARTGWQAPLAQVQMQMVDRAGMRARLCDHEGYSTVAAFVLSWVMPITYAPELGRVLVVAPTANRYDEATLRFQLASALSMGAVGQKYPNFFNHLARRVISVRQSGYDIYACQGWAQALAESVGIEVAKEGRAGPWWQRFGMLCLWPFAPFAVGPGRLARRLVPVVEEAARSRPGLVERMLRFPPLCRALYSKPGRSLLVVAHEADYKRADLAEDVAFLRRYNPQAGATSFSAEL